MDSDVIDSDIIDNDIIDSDVIDSNVTDSDSLCTCAAMDSNLLLRIDMNIIIIIIMVIFKCYFSGELIALSYKKQQRQQCEHRIRKNKQIKSTVHDANKKMK